MGQVALLARAWIEINVTLPTKLNPYVALLARAWIEMVWPLACRYSTAGRSPCESVD